MSFSFFQQHAFILIIFTLYLPKSSWGYYYYSHCRPLFLTFQLLQNIKIRATNFEEHVRGKPTTTEGWFKPILISFYFSIIKKSINYCHFE